MMKQMLIDVLEREYSFSPETRKSLNKLTTSELHNLTKDLETFVQKVQNMKNVVKPLSEADRNMLDATKDEPEICGHIKK